MNTQSNAVPGYPQGSQPVAPAIIMTPRPMYWSIRRELWEYRSICIAPLAVAAIFLFGFLISMITLPHRMRAAGALDPMKQHDLIEQPYHFASLLIMGVAFFVAIFYCLDALHGERRDRSILFWKSLPVSDLTTVLAKASIPMVIIPLLSFAITLVVQWIMLLLNTAALAGSGLGSAMPAPEFSMFSMSMMLLYHLLAIHSLWYAPLYGWLLLVSAWARRAAFLWAALPLVAIGVIEKLAFNSRYFVTLLHSRISGGEAGDATTPGSSMMHPVTLLTVTRFLSSPGLWIGLAFFAIFLALAVQVRRYREPL